MIGNIGPLEIAIVLVIALIVFGPKRLPELGSSLGRGMREFKETVTGEKKDDEVKAISSAQATAGPNAKRPEPELADRRQG
jgi:sec-independent protein translocase protein TatA